MLKKLAILSLILVSSYGYSMEQMTEIELVVGRTQTFEVIEGKIHKSQCARYNLPLGTWRTKTISEIKEFLITKNHLQNVNENLYGDTWFGETILFNHQQLGHVIDTQEVVVLSIFPEIYQLQ